MIHFVLHRVRLDVWVFRFSSLFLLLSSLFSPVSYSQWCASPYVNTAICTATGTQNYPQAVSDGAGGVIVVWMDTRGSSYDIYAQRVNALGTVQWTPNGVAICAASNNQTFPQLCSDGNGGAIIAWQDQRIGSQYDIYTQRVNAVGNVEWPANGIALCTFGYDQTNSQICTDGAGGAIVTWQDYRSGSGYYDIYAQHVDSWGQIPWTANGIVICTATGDQSYQCQVSDGAGGAIIAWQDYRSGSNNDIYAQRGSAAGVVQWTSNGVAICNPPGHQSSPQLFGDGVGGTIIVWTDNRSGTNYDIYAQRVNAIGSYLWTYQGVAICTAASEQTNPFLAGDGAGGAIITWVDQRSGTNADIYAQRVSTAGMVQWASNGVVICTQSYTQYVPRIICDGVGGAIIAWLDQRNASTYEMYAQQVNASGVAQWTSDGVRIATTPVLGVAPQIVNQSTGGAIMTWSDTRDGSQHIYAQNVDRYGYLGIVAPAIAHCRDIPNDQGGRAVVMWDHSCLDALPNPVISGYEIYRGVRTTMAGTGYAITPGQEHSDQQTAVTVARTSMIAGDAATSGGGIYWEYVNTVAAKKLEHYSCSVATLSDSGPQGNSLNYFMVRAYLSSNIFWDSAPDSGYSVDNLPPGTPVGGRVSVIAANSIRVSWDADTGDPDVGYYAVYRSTSSGFTPSPASLLVTTADTGYVDNTAASGSAYYYRVATVDIHGNQSPPTDELSLSFTRSLAAGWNMVSLPGSMPDAYYLTAYPGATTNSLYSFSGTYVLTDVLHLGTGYWLKYAATTNVTTNSAPVSSQSIALVSGWNMIGGPSCTITTGAISDPSNVIVTGTFYGFERGYTAVSTLQRGKGYWVRAAGAGTITMSCGSSPKQAPTATLVNLSSLPALRVSDASGGEQTLYYNVSFNAPEEQLCYSLPPLPAEGCFDARFAGDYRAVQAGGGTIHVQSAHYPITVNAMNIPAMPDAQYVLVEMEGGKEGTRHVLASGVPIEIQSANVKTLILRKESAVPLVFALEQNYPNPFNPSTVIRYQLPVASDVKLLVYDLLGREVARLVDEHKPAGYHEVQFEPSGLASGMYVYRITAGKFVDTKKLVLVK
jgi:hypothetical protein